MNIDTVRRKICRSKQKFNSCLLKWSERNSPLYAWRKTSDTYSIMIAEMLLRRTRATSVEIVYNGFLEKFPTVKVLAKCSARKIEKEIKSLGIKSRSNKIKSVAEKIVIKYPNKFPSNEKELLDVFGSGSRYTVNAIRCFAKDQHVPIFDVNVKRIFERVFSIKFEKDSHKKKSSWEIVSFALPERKVKQYNWALLDLGKAVCISSKPRCEICPLNSICDYAGKNS